MPVELAAELISGPDLGGGFLFQLSRDRAPLPAGFTYHVQDAGSDASAAPAGAPDRIGYARPERPCMYGGRECWHKGFALPASEALRVRTAYNRTRFVIGPMLAQASGSHPAPVRAGLRELLGRIAGPLEAEGIAWQIAGSTAAWIRGVPLAPADIDVGVAAPGAARVAELVEEYLVEPLHPDEASGGAGHLVAAAFVGTFSEGIRVEWGSRAASPDGPARSVAEGGGPGWVERRARVAWERWEVPLAPIEFELIRSAERGRDDRVELLLAHLQREGNDAELLARLLAGATLAPQRRGRIEAALGGRGTAGATESSA
jgi:hypothetical protein